jgi:hypothetical protein
VRFIITVNLIGNRDLAFPIVAVAVKFNAIPIRKYKVDELTKEDRALLLEESDFIYKKSFLYPNELTEFNKRRKIADLLERVIYFLSYKTQDFDVVTCKDLPPIHFPDVKYYQTSEELRLALWKAEQLRFPYIVKAHQAKPYFDWINNQGASNKSHYKKILQYGFTRHHHSVTPYHLISYIYRLYQKQDLEFDWFYKFISKTPRWWWHYCDTPIRDFFEDHELRGMKDLVTRIHRERDRHKSRDYRKFLKGKRKVPSQFKEWMNENKPDDLELPFYYE